MKTECPSERQIVWCQGLVNPAMCAGCDSCVINGRTPMAAMHG